MKPATKRKVLIGLLIFVVVMVVAVWLAFWANANGYRAVWDKAMLWINFLILATIVYKVIWPILMKMLQARINGIADEISGLEKESAEIEAEIKKLEESLTQSAQRFAEMQEKLNEEFKLKRAQIIENAQKEALAILEASKTQRTSMLGETKKKLKGELIDLAVNKALQSLPKAITADDQAHLFDVFAEKAFSA